MKKKFLLIVFIFYQFLFLACTKESNYQTNVYESIPGYKNATCNIMKNKYIELHIENEITSSKEEITSLLNSLQNNYDKLNNTFNLNTKIKCYVINNIYIFENTKAIYQNGILLCDKSALFDENLLNALTGSYIQSTEFWKQYGACAYAFNYQFNNEEIKKYYLNGNDLALTLFQTYFMDEFSTNKNIAIETSYSFSNFIINKYGYEKFINANLTSYREEYLNHLKINRKFDISFDLSWLDNATYSQKFLSYPLVIKTFNRTYYLNSFSSKRDTASFNNSERVLYHLSTGNTECEKILNYIKDNAPESYNFVSEKYNSNIEYYISENEIKTCSDVTNGKIYLLDPSEFVHETIHAITLKSNPTKEAWIGEGIAEYLSRHVSRHISDINNRFYLSFTDKTLSGNIKDFVDIVNSIYKEKGGKFSTLDEFDFSLLAKCIGEITLKNNTYKSSINFPYATTPIYMTYASTSQDGNVLTYPEAYAFTSYLIEKYGFNNAIKCCINYNLKEIYGADYSNLMNEFLKVI